MPRLLHSAACYAKSSALAEPPSTYIVHALQSKTKRNTCLSADAAALEAASLADEEQAAALWAACDAARLARSATADFVLHCHATHSVC